MADLKDKLKQLIDTKQELLAEKAKIEAKLELAQSELQEAHSSVYSLFGTNDIAQLKEIRTRLIDEAETLVADFNKERF